VTNTGSPHAPPVEQLLVAVRRAIGADANRVPKIEVEVQQLVQALPSGVVSRLADTPGHTGTQLLRFTEAGGALDQTDKPAWHHRTVIIWDLTGERVDLDLERTEFLLVSCDLIGRLGRNLGSAADADELHVWIVTPPGAGASPAWGALRLEFARDTYTCPKGVWVPGSNPKFWADEAAAFVETTFLARPWAHAGTGEDSRLDDLGTSLRKKGKTRTADLYDRLIPNWNSQLSDAKDAHHLDDTARLLLRVVDDWLSQDPQPAEIVEGELA
jgi:hypothetical protein